MISLSFLLKFKNSSDILDKERLENVNELLLSIDEFCKRNPGSSLKDFLQEVSLLTDIDQWNSSKNRVTLMTVHSSKGTEAEYVILTDFLNMFNLLLNNQE